MRHAYLTLAELWQQAYPSFLNGAFRITTVHATKFPRNKIIVILMLINKIAVLSQGEPRDAAVNFDVYSL